VPDLVLWHVRGRVRREHCVDVRCRPDRADGIAVRVGRAEGLLQVRMQAERRRRHVEEPRDARMPLGVEEVRVRDVEPRVGNAYEDAGAVQPRLVRDGRADARGRRIEERVKGRRDLDGPAGVSVRERDDARRGPPEAREPGGRLAQPHVTRTDTRGQSNERADAAGATRRKGILGAGSQ
jgi:hypothetical protein